MSCAWCDLLRVGVFGELNHRQSFHFDTRGHQTGAHTDETSTPLDEGPTPAGSEDFKSLNVGRSWLPPQWVGTTSRGPTGGRVLEGVLKLPFTGAKILAVR